MRAARDLILVICAVISTACLVYMAINFDLMWADGSTPETSSAAEDAKPATIERPKPPAANK